jgi:ADP-ribosylglycohydrolase
MTALDRAYGALLGLAIGDALGMPTQYMPRSLVLERFASLVASRLVLATIPSVAACRRAASPTTLIRL